MKTRGVAKSILRDRYKTVPLFANTGEIYSCRGGVVKIRLRVYFRSSEGGGGCGGDLLRDAFPEISRDALFWNTSPQKSAPRNLK